MPATPIFIACPNLSLDRTMWVELLEVGHVHRSDRSDVRGGGKGINVARALSCVGSRAAVAGMAAGHTGDAVVALLADEGIDIVATQSSGETRSCLTVLNPHGATVFNESGPHIGDAEWRRYRQLIEHHVPARGIFVCSGSWPPGSPEDAAAQLIHLAADRGCITICDTSRAQLARALPAEPDVVKPNLDEALDVLGAGVHERIDPGRGLTDARLAARELLTRGPKAVVVSAGAAGAVFASTDEIIDLPAHDVHVVNPIGAGDCLVAGVAGGLAQGRDLQSSVLWGVAMAAASCETLAAGELSRARADELYASSSAI